MKDYKKNKGLAEKKENKTVLPGSQGDARSSQHAAARDDRAAGACSGSSGNGGDNMISDMDRL
jgi:hypothetical protein